MISVIETEAAAVKAKLEAEIERLGRSLRKRSTLPT